MSAVCIEWEKKHLQKQDFFVKKIVFFSFEKNEENLKSNHRYDFIFVVVVEFSVTTTTNVNPIIIGKICFFELQEKQTIDR